MKMKKWIAFVLAFCMIFCSVGCGDGNATEPSADNGASANKESSATDESPAENEVSADNGTSAAGAETEDVYSEPVTLTTIVFQTLTQSVPEGISLENNPWRDLWESQGIHVEYSAIAADNTGMTSEVNLAIASQEVPDVMSVGYSTYKELLEADMLADLTDVFEQYASDDLKRMMYADGGVMAGNVTEDGRLYGIVQPADYLDKGAVVAIRTDWLKELNLEYPDSIDGLWEVAKAFKDNNMGGTCTIGIGATKEVADMLAMKYLIDAHGGVVSSWLEKDSELVYGLIQPETKNALSRLHDKYAEGLLDQEYGTKSEQQLFEDAVSGKSGIVICNMTAPFYLDNGISLGQEWGYFPLYGEKGKLAPVEVNLGFNSAVVVNKDCANPEAVIKLFNMFIKYGYEEADVYASDGVNNLSYPFIISEVGVNQAIHQAYKSFLETGVTPDPLPAGYDGTVEQCENFRVNGDVDGRTLYTIFAPENSTQAAIARQVEEGSFLISAFTGTPGDAFVKYSGNLGTMSDQMIANIITGASPVDYFDEFVDIWKSNGGDEITREVNEWYQNN